MDRIELIVVNALMCSTILEVIDLGLLNLVLFNRLKRHFIAFKF